MNTDVFDELFMAEKYGEFFSEKEAIIEMKKFLQAFKKGFDKNSTAQKAAELRKTLLG
mgnify:CR=1 FL=1